MKNGRWLLVALALGGMAAVLLACGTAATTATPTATAPAIDVASVKALTDLNSFRSSVEISFQGVYSDGTQAMGSEYVTEEYVKSPRAFHVAMWGMVPSAGMNNVAEDAPVESYLVDNRMLTNLTGSWTQTPVTGIVSSSASGVANSILNNLTSAVFQGTENYNGVEALHYTFNQTHLDPAKFPQGLSVDSASGTIYLAVEGNYVIHAELTLTGADAGVPITAGVRPMKSGTTKYSVDVTDANKPVTVKVPDLVLQASAPPADLPLMADATLLSRLEKKVIYTSGKTLEEISAFYRAEMPKNGWTETTANPAEKSTLTFGKGGTTATVLIAQQDTGKTLVEIQFTGAK